MQKGKFDISRINNSIQEVELNFNKVDEWFIPRDRVNFYLTHDFHPYFAAYPPELVSRLLNKYSNKGDIFLDPFMGGGSSIVEGYRLKRNTIGMDISPFAKFISEVKTNPIKVNDKKILSILFEIKNDIFNNRLTQFKNFNYKTPKITNIDKWFKKEVQFELAIILNHLNNIEDESLRKFLLLAFSSIIRKVSNAKNAQQHVCIARDKKIPNAYLLFEEKVKLMSNQMKEYVLKLGDLKDYKMPELYSHDIRKMDEIIKPGSVDIIITSPPYGTGSRYTEVNRLNFEWLGLEKPLRGTTLESTNDFKNELKKGIEKMYVVLKKGGYCFVVYGDPSTEDSLTRIAIRDALDVGFKYNGLISCPIEKTISNHHEKYRRFIPKDFILIFKK